MFQEPGGNVDIELKPIQICAIAHRALRVVAVSASDLVRQRVWINYLKLIEERARGVVNEV